MDGAELSHTSSTPSGWTFLAPGFIGGLLCPPCSVDSKPLPGQDLTNVPNPAPCVDWDTALTLDAEEMWVEGFALALSWCLLQPVWWLFQGALCFLQTGPFP